MTGFFEELTNIVGLPFDELSSGYKLELVAGKALSVTNYKKILIYTKNKIVLSLKHGIIEILGENLTIKQLDIGSIIVSGIIHSISDGEKNE